jgi:hypothetical protein
LGVPRRERDERIIERARKAFASLPDLDHRSPDEIIGYDKDGLPR